MTPKEKQLALRKKGRSHSAVTSRERRSNPEKGPKDILSESFQAYLGYLLNLSAAGKKTNDDWTWLKKKLKEEGHWKKSYK